MFQILLLLVSSALVQNEQLMKTKFNLEFGLDIMSVNITDENSPLTFDIDTEVNDEEILFLDIPSDSIPMVIEVFHPIILERFMNLQRASLISCGMKRIAQNSFEKCENLKSLVLQFNLIEEIPAGVFRNCKNLTLLALDGNKISRIEPESFVGLTRMSILGLTENKLTSISTGLFTQMKTYSLDLGFNPIQKIESRAFPDDVKILNINHCKITELHPESFLNLTQLKSLELSNNPITELPPGIFSTLANLLRIYLFSTKIQRLNSDSFGKLEKLEILSITSSGLDEIQPCFFDNFPALKIFRATGNLCINTILDEDQKFDFKENPVLNQCYANWYVPRSTTEIPDRKEESGFFGNLWNKLKSKF